MGGEGAQLTNSPETYRQYSGIKINYSPARILADEVWIRPHSLLFETGIQSQQTDCFVFNKLKAFFKTEGDYPFDIFAASFYLLTRYEEYLPHQKDEYGRYSHKESLAYKEGFLNQPLINKWIRDFKSVLQEKFPALAAEAFLPKQTFTFLPTYDIDMAWSYLHKGFFRNAGGLIRSIFKCQWHEASERINVLRKKEKDPFDAFSWLNKLHDKYKVRPYYFFLVANNTGKYDKNISPGTKAMKELIRDHSIRYPVGIHPSWQSGNKTDLLRKEIDTLSAIKGNVVTASRQHYIRFTLPGTFRRLSQHGIGFEFSMGYGTINGFRASVASPFYWYDLEKEEQTKLLLFPFCFMEANSFYEQRHTAGEALAELSHYFKEVKSVAGTFIMIWHNSFLGSSVVNSQWKEMYENFIKSTAS